MRNQENPNRRNFFQSLATHGAAALAGAGLARLRRENKEPPYEQHILKALEWLGSSVKKEVITGAINSAIDSPGFKATFENSVTKRQVKIYMDTGKRLRMDLEETGLTLTGDKATNTT